MNQQQPAQYGNYQAPQGMIIQISQPPAEPQCCCCGARNGLMIWLGICGALSILSVFYASITGTGYYTTALNVPSYMIVVAVLQAISYVYPFVALAKENVKHIRLSAFVYIGLQILSWILSIVYYVVTVNALNTAFGVSQNSFASAIRDAISTTVLINVLYVILSQLLFLAIIVNRMFAARKYLMDMQQFTAQTGGKPNMMQQPVYQQQPGFQPQPQYPQGQPVYNP